MHLYWYNNTLRDICIMFCGDVLVVTCTVYYEYYNYVVHSMDAALCVIQFYEKNVS